MRRLTSLFLLAISALCLSSAAFAQHATYAITNDDNPNPNANTGTVFVPTPNGQLKILKTLQTGGTGLGGGNFATPRAAVESNAGCIFLADGGSNDIASFSEAAGFAKVGNFTRPGLNSLSFGIGMVVSQDGKFLYASYPVSQNIQAWSIGADNDACVLSVVGQPIALSSAATSLAITNDGSVLIVSQADEQTVLAFSSTNGMLTSLGSPLDMSQESECSGGCFPAGMDTTNVSNGKAVVAVANGTANSRYPNVITLGLDETTGLSFLSNAPITNVGSLGNPQNPLFSPQGRTGTGDLYLATSGEDMYDGVDPGIIILSISNGTINPIAAAYLDVSSSEGFSFCGNLAIAKPDGSGGEGKGLWLMNYDQATGVNTVWLYELSGNSIQPYASLIDPNGAHSLVLSIASIFGNQN